MTNMWSIIILLMEDRKKTLRDLEEAKADTLELLDNLLEKLGESLVSRMETSGGKKKGKNQESDSRELAKAEGDNPALLWEEKKSLLRDIADSEGNIKAIEADLRHLGELEEKINQKEREKNEKAKELFLLCTELGRLVLADPGFENFTASFEQEMNDISLKIDFQQKKLEELDSSEGNFFTRLTNGVKGMVTKAMLSKNEAALERLYRSAGEQFLVFMENSSGREEPEFKDGEIDTLTHDGLKQRKTHEALKEEIAGLKAERRETADAIDQKGNPARRISELEVRITRIKEEIRALHRRFGACARKNEWKDHFSSLYSESDKILDDKIASLYESLKDTETKIEATKIAIAIDNENAEIAKLKDAIEDKKRRIADAESAITGMQGQIAAAEKRIEDLTGKHGEKK